MVKPPGLGDYLFIVGFFVIGVGGVLMMARKMSLGAPPWARIATYLTSAPLLYFIGSCALSWTRDMTANNLWPIGLVMLAVPTGIVWSVIGVLSRWWARRNETPLE